MAASTLRMLFAVANLTLIAGPLAGQTIYPIDRATILAGARFDFKVEFPVVENPADLKITINGEDYSRPLSKAGQFVEKEDGLDASSLVCAMPASASDGVHSADDAVLTALGPGSERVHGFMDNTEVFQVMVNALGLGRVE
jgi:hypothetical protein